VLRGLRSTKGYVYVEPRKIPLVTGGNRSPAWLVIKKICCLQATVAPQNRRTVDREGLEFGNAMMLSEILATMQLTDSEILANLQL
jgi:hypothetical protein